MPISLGSKLAIVVGEMSPHESALIRFAQAFLARVESRGTPENRAGASSRERLHAALREALGLLPELTHERRERGEAPAVFVSGLREAFETLPDDLVRLFDGHLKFKRISRDNAGKIAAALRGSFHRYADQAEITDPI